MQEAVKLSDRSYRVKRTDKNTDAKIKHKRAWARLQLGPSAFYYRGTRQILLALSPLREGPVYACQRETARLLPAVHIPRRCELREHTPPEPRDIAAGPKAVARCGHGQ